MAKASLQCGRKLPLRTNGMGIREIVVEDASPRRGVDSEQSTNTASRDGYPRGETGAATPSEQRSNPPPETSAVQSDRAGPVHGQPPGDRHVQVGRRLPGRMPKDDFH